MGVRRPQAPGRGLHFLVLVALAVTAHGQVNTNLGGVGVGIGSSGVNVSLGASGTSQGPAASSVRAPAPAGSTASILAPASLARPSRGPTPLPSATLAGSVPLPSSNLAPTPLARSPRTGPAPAALQSSAAIPGPLASTSSSGSSSSVAVVTGVAGGLAVGAGSNPASVGAQSNVSISANATGGLTVNTSGLTTGVSNLTTGLSSSVQGVGAAVTPSIQAILGTGGTQGSSSSQAPSAQQGSGGLGAVNVNLPLPGGGSVGVTVQPSNPNTLVQEAQGNLSTALTPIAAEVGSLVGQAAETVGAVLPPTQAQAGASINITLTTNVSASAGAGVNPQSLANGVTGALSGTVSSLPIPPVASTSVTLPLPGNGNVGVTVNPGDVNSAVNAIVAALPPLPGEQQANVTVSSNLTVSASGGAQVSTGDLSGLLSGSSSGQAAAPSPQDSESAGTLTLPLIDNITLTVIAGQVASQVAGALSGVLAPAESVVQSLPGSILPGSVVVSSNASVAAGAQGGAQVDLGAQPPANGFITLPLPGNPNISVTVDVSAALDFLLSVQGGSGSETAAQPASPASGPAFELASGPVPGLSPGAPAEAEEQQPTARPPSTGLQSLLIHVGDELVEVSAEQIAILLQQISGLAGASAAAGANLTGDLSLDATVPGSNMDLLAGAVGVPFLSAASGATAAVSLSLSANATLGTSAAQRSVPVPAPITMSLAPAPAAAPARQPSSSSSSSSDSTSGRPVLTLPVPGNANVSLTVNVSDVANISASVGVQGSSSNGAPVPSGVDGPSASSFAPGSGAGRSASAPSPSTTPAANHSSGSVILQLPNNQTANVTASQIGYLLNNLTGALAPTTAAAGDLVIELLSPLPSLNLSTGSVRLPVTVNGNANVSVNASASAGASAGASVNPPGPSQPFSPPPPSPPPPPPPEPLARRIAKAEIQVFIILTNLSATATVTGRKLNAHAELPPTRGRRLLAPLDNIQFSALVVPRLAGTPPFATPPTTAASLFIGDQAPAGNVSVYDGGAPLATINIDNGAGSVQTSVERGSHSFGAAFASDSGFTSTAGGTSAIVGTDGTITVGYYVPPPVLAPARLSAAGSLSAPSPAPGVLATAAASGSVQRPGSVQIQATASLTSLSATPARGLLLFGDNTLVSAVVSALPPSAPVTTGNLSLYQNRTLLTVIRVVNGTGNATAAINETQNSYSALYKADAACDVVPVTIRGADGQIVSDGSASNRSSTVSTLCSAPGPAPDAGGLFLAGRIAPLPAGSAQGSRAAAPAGTTPVPAAGPSEFAQVAAPSGPTRLPAEGPAPGPRRASISPGQQQQPGQAPGPQQSTPSQTLPGPAPSPATAPGDAAAAVPSSGAAGSVQIQATVSMTNLSASSGASRGLLQATATDSTLITVSVSASPADSSVGTGTLTLYDDGTLLATIRVVNGSGNATVAIARTQHSYYAFYQADVACDVVPVTVRGTDGQIVSDGSASNRSSTVSVTCAPAPAPSAANAVTLPAALPTGPTAQAPSTQVPSSPAGAPPSPVRPVFQVQLFITVTNLSAAASPAQDSQKRRLLQSPSSAGSDDVILTALLFPLPEGAALYSLPPADPGALVLDGQSASGSVLLYDRSTLLGVVNITGGQGSIRTSLQRSSHFFSASYAADNGFPANGQSAIVVNSDGSLQPATDSAQGPAAFSSPANGPQQQVVNNTAYGSKKSFKIAISVAAVAAAAAIFAVAAWLIYSGRLVLPGSTKRRVGGLQQSGPSIRTIRSMPRQRAAAGRTATDED